MIKKQTKLYERWITFIKIIFDPWVVLLSIILVLLFIYAGDSEKIALKYIFALLVSIISGLLGAIIMRKWIDLNDENIMIVRGLLTIRSLKLMYQSLQQTENRIKKYIENLDESEKNFSLIKSNFEEVKEKCLLLKEECINSIENWTDIIDEANVKTRLSTLKKLKLEEEKLEGKIYILDKIIQEDKNIDENKQAQMRDRIEQIEIELKELRTNISLKENEINSSILSGLLDTSLPTESVYSLYKSCPSCGSFYSGSNICPFCGEPFTAPQRSSN